MIALSVIAWIVLGFAIAGLMFSLVLVFTLRSRGLNFHEMTRVEALLMALPSAIVLGLAIAATACLAISAEWSTVFVVFAGLGLAALLIFQFAATVPLIEAERELQRQNEQRLEPKTLRTA